MVSGRETLTRMDETLRRARREVRRLDDTLQATSVRITRNKLLQVRAIDRMASLWLDAARRGEVIKALDTARESADEILADRESAIAQATESLQEATDALETFEARRASLHEEVDEAARTLAEREASVQKELEADEAFNAQLERSREAEAIATSALEKAEVADEDRRLKGQPYESDELFMYLWKRGYGTPAYTANPLARLLDGWVARRCGYDDARANYWMLLEIPRRLAEHADRAREAADSELDRLQDIEERAAIEGGVPAARERLAELERQQDELDTQIATAEERFAERQAEHARFAAGEDDYLARALRVFSAAMEDRHIDELMQVARATMTPEDDAVVGELRELRREAAELDTEIDSNRALQRERLDRIRELEDVRRDFKRDRYDDLHSSFERGDLIERMIGEVVDGVVRSGALKDLLRRYQHYTDAAGEWPDFGSGGVPGRRRKPRKPARPPTWHWPGSGSKGGGFRLPRSRGGGGFRTGGGF